MLKLVVPVCFIALMLACIPSMPADNLPVEGPVIAEFNISPTEIQAGDTALITWIVEGASEVTMEPDIGVMPSTGSMQINPDETTVYTVRAVNNSGTVTRSLTVTVMNVPPAASVEAHDSRLPTVPVLVSPVNGAVFDHYPRTIKFKWQPSKGELPMTYVLQVQYDTRETPGSFQGYYAPITLTNIEYSLDFKVNSAGRWCVMAKNDYGISDYSDWWYFQFTK